MAHRIGRYQLANTFLTKSGEVGMQWGLISPKHANMVDTFTIWTERHFTVLRSSSTHPVPVEVYGQALDFFERNSSKYLAF